MGDQSESLHAKRYRPVADSQERLRQILVGLAGNVDLHLSHFRWRYPLDTLPSENLERHDVDNRQPAVHFAIIHGNNESRRDTMEENR